MIDDEIAELRKLVDGLRKKLHGEELSNKRAVWGPYPHPTALADLVEETASRENLLGFTFEQTGLREHAKLSHDRCSFP